MSLKETDEGDVSKLRENQLISVVSDLHLFSSRSRAEHYSDKLSRAADSSDYMVLNGDIFDFKWSLFGEDTIQKASTWITEFCKRHPRCKVIYVMGNHDALRAWADQCRILADDIENFTFSMDYYRTDSALITHGDLLLGRSPRVSRELTDAFPPLNRWLDRIYTVACMLMLPRLLVSILHGPRRSAVCFRSALRRLPCQLVDGVDRLVVGHTHAPFTELAVDGILISNSGSAVHGMQFNLLQFSLGLDVRGEGVNIEQEALYEPV